MATWGGQTSPVVKFEASPAESFISTPDEMYPSLFRDSTPSSTLNPLDIMTPRSDADGKNGDATLQLPTLAELADDPATSAANPERKPTKKRKSWGQVLPEPKTNLPPRKRAKTEDEKEQRRVERVLRNRRAAQSSRERKRLEVEALELRNQDLEARLLKVEKMNLLLVEQLNKFRRTSGVVARSSSPLGSLQSNQLTLSQELFSSQDGPRFLDANASSLMDLSMAESGDTTVNPASLSPQLTPVPDALAAPSEASSTSTSADLTQRPAVSSVGGSAAVVEDLADRPGALDPPTPDNSNGHLVDCIGLPSSFDADRYVLESGLLSSPNSVDYENDYLAGDSADFLSEPFDISQFLHDDVAPDAAAGNGFAFAAEPELDFLPTDLENQNPTENPNLQPQSGASASGCDDRGIAVGV